MRARTLVAISVIALAVPAHAQTLTDGERAAIAEWSYGYFSDEGRLFETLAYQTGIASYCVNAAAADPKMETDLGDLAALLAPVEPQLRDQLFELGASGLLGEPSGVVPFAPIGEIAEIKGVSEDQFCEGLAAVVRGQVHSLVTDCSVNADRTGFDCPDTRQFFLIPRDQ